MTHRYSKDPEVDNSLRHSVRDGVAYSVMSGAGETYLSAFAVFLHANTAQIGLLTSLPALIGSLAQLLSAWLGRHVHSRMRVILPGVVVQALVWLPLMWLPVLFPAQAVPLLVLFAMVYFAMGSLVTPQWSSLMGDLVPERRRGRYFARRTAFASLTAFIALVCAGVVLDLFDKFGRPLTGYLLIFTVAACARLVSAHHLRYMHDPTGRVSSLEFPNRREWLNRLRHSPFVRFSMFFALMQFSVAIASPFFTVYMLRDLQYSYLEYTVNTASSVLMQFITLNMWGRMSDRFGNRLILVATGLFIPILPALWVLSTHFWYLIGVQMLAGLCWAGFSLSTGNFLYDLVPADKRVTYMALHNMMANIGIFFGALLGGLLGVVLPNHLFVSGHEMQWMSVLYGVFLISTLARIIVSVLFLPHLKEVREVKPMSVSGLVFRVTRIHALSGLIFDVMGRRRRDVNDQ